MGVLEKYVYGGGANLLYSDVKKEFCTCQKCDPDYLVLSQWKNIE
jgi:hypothetical protein